MQSMLSECYLPTIRSSVRCTAIRSAAGDRQTVAQPVARIDSTSSAIDRLAMQCMAGAETDQFLALVAAFEDTLNEAVHSLQASKRRLWPPRTTVGVPLSVYY